MADQRRTLTGKLLRFSTAAVDLFFCFIATAGLITIVGVFALYGTGIAADRYLIVLLALSAFSTTLALLKPPISEPRGA